MFKNEFPITSCWVKRSTARFSPSELRTDLEHYWGGSSHLIKEYKLDFLEFQRALRLVLLRPCWIKNILSFRKASAWLGLARRVQPERSNLFLLDSADFYTGAGVTFTSEGGPGWREEKREMERSESLCHTERLPVTHKPGGRAVERRTYFQALELSKALPRTHGQTYVPPSRPVPSPPHVNPTHVSQFRVP